MSNPAVYTEREGWGIYLMGFLVGFMFGAGFVFVGMVL